MLLSGCVLTALMAFPFVWLLDTHNIFAIIVALMLALPICNALTYAPQASFIPELFPTQLRYSGSGIAYTVGCPVFSAPVLFVAALVRPFRGELATGPLHRCRCRADLPRGRRGPGVAPRRDRLVERPDATRAVPSVPAVATS